MKIRIVLILVALVVLAAMGIYLFRPQQPSPPEVTYCDEQSEWRECFASVYAAQKARKAFEYPRESSATATRRYLRINYTFQNLENRRADSLRFWCYLPLAGYPGQTLHSVQLSMPAKTAQDSFGHRILQAAWNDIAPNETVIFRVLLAVDLTKLPPVQPEPGERYLAAEPLVQSEHPEIQRLAARMKRKTPDRTAANIFRYVREKVAPNGYDGRDYGALWALQNKQGDCTEMAMLFTALCRAAGVPARVLAGFVADHDRLIQAKDFHNWAQYFHQGQWHMADPYYGNFNEKEERYVAMEIFRPMRHNPVEKYHLYRFNAGDVRFKVNY